MHSSTSYLFLEFILFHTRENFRVQHTYQKGDFEKMLLYIIEKILGVKNQNPALLKKSRSCGYLRNFWVFSLNFFFFRDVG